MFGFRAIACSIGLFCLIPAIAASAGDWPQWGGCDGRNMVSNEKHLPDSFAPGEKMPHDAGIDLKTTKNVKWATRLGSYAYGNPTVSGGKLFVGTDDLTLRDDPRFKRSRGGLVKCLDEQTGKLLWQLVVPTRTGLPKGALFGHQFLGICSSPAVDGNRVYVITSRCEVACLDVNGQADGNDGPFTDEARYMAGPGQPPVELTSADADIIWLFDMIDELGVCPHDAASCSVLIHGDLLYTSTSNGVDKPHLKVISPDAPSLIVLDKATGRLAATDGQGIGHRLFHCQWSPPSLGVVNGRTLVFLGGGDGVCYALEAIDKAPEKPVQLKKVWSYDCNPPRYKFRDGKPIPYYDGDKRKHRGNKDDGLYVGPSQIIATPVFHENRVYVAIGQDPAHGRGKGMLHAIDATKTGDITETGKVWTYDELDRTISSVAIADGLLYLPDIAGRLHCLDLKTGKRLWVHDLQAEAWGSTLIADGKLYLGTKRHFFVLAAGRQHKLLSEIHLGSPSYTSPIVANGTLYVASQRYIWAIEQDITQTAASR